MNVIVADANSIFARSFYAAEMAGDGSRANDLALATILSLLDPNSDKIGVKIHQTLFCWDTLQKRDKGRPPKPPLYHQTKDELVQLLTAMIGAEHSIIPGYEADDQVATAAYREPLENHVYIVSGDKDLQQLVSLNVSYYCLNKKRLLTRQQITDKWKIKKPCQLAIALAVIGDKSDAVSGIKGWGPKRVETLFEQVPDTANFEEALDIVDSQIPSSLKPIFYESLDLTLLNPAIENVPYPKAIKLADQDTITSLDISAQIVGRFEMLREVIG